jgi:hypothetical protein
VSFERWATKLVANRIRDAFPAVHVALSGFPAIAATFVLILYRVWRGMGPFDSLRQEMLSLTNGVCVTAFYAIPIWLASATLAAYIMRSRSQAWCAVAFAGGWASIVSAVTLSSPAGVDPLSWTPEDVQRSPRWRTNGSGTQKSCRRS